MKIVLTVLVFSALIIGLYIYSIEHIIQSIDMGSSPDQNKNIGRKTTHIFNNFPVSSQELHFLRRNNNEQKCYDDNVRRIPSGYINENEMNFETISINHTFVKYYHLCIGRHHHYHTIKISMNESSAVSCNIYISVDNPSPSKQNYDWKLKSFISQISHSINIHTYSKEFFDSHDGGLYFAVASDNILNHSQQLHCEFGIGIYTFTDDELVHKLNLRGGQVLLKRDIMT